MPTVITLVENPACHFCADAEAGLDQLAREFPVTVDRVPADSDAGQALVGHHRPSMFPLILVDGSYFSAGRLPRAKLRALLVGGTAVGDRS